MNITRWIGVIVMLGLLAHAEVPELTALVPQATGYELIAKLDPTAYMGGNYAIDRSEILGGDVKRIGYLLKLTDKAGKLSWAFAAMDPFCTNIERLALPAPGGDIFQDYVTNLEVFSNVPAIKTGTFPKGNVEIWGCNYGGGNSKGIPGATSAFDFGDQPDSNGSGSYGCLQVHNFAEKQVVLAFNNFRNGKTCDLGIGNNTEFEAQAGGSKTPHPDWTFSRSGQSYQQTELFIVAKIDNLTVKEITLLNANKASLTGTLDREQALFAPGEEMAFKLVADFQGQQPTNDYFISWERTGDDGAKDSGKAKVGPEPLIIKTSLDRPGFVRILAYLVDKNGRRVTKTVMRRGKEAQENIFFDGGAGVDIDKLQGVPEPADFDAFWTKQKARLAAVPMNTRLDEQPSKDPKVKIYAVSIDCAGPRPVTGYLTVPADAKEKSLPAHASFHGYGTSIQRAPTGGSSGHISFNVNAHGYDLGQSEEYYQAFFESIKSNGHGYAFDPEQNKDPETAYFNGMALRVMRALEYLKSRPEWDGKNLNVSGGSQGGLQTVWAAGLDAAVVKASPGIPWCCDLGGVTLGRITAGWRLKYVEALDYYDPINHAKRIPTSCYVDITRAGLGDYTCPPSGVAILYNNIPGPKRINWVQGSTHGYTPPNAQAFVLEQK
ncbi:MAG: acetylxylan esterase [Lentisphaerae bacterium]|nr:acetylxylan esterase [Lentisphaerota bacterium]